MYYYLQYPLKYSYNLQFTNDSFLIQEKSGEGFGKHGTIPVSQGLLLCEYYESLLSYITY